MMQRTICAGLAALLLASWTAIAAAADDFLPPDQAFRYSVSHDGDALNINWRVAKGYYLYRKRMGVESPDGRLTLAEPVYPTGEMHSDEFFGEQEVFRGGFTVRVPATSAEAVGTALPVDLKLQGCADAGLCYPPTTWRASVKLAAAPATVAAPAARGLDLFSAARDASNDSDFLPLDEAFRLAVFADGPDRVRLVWEIAPGYYLYRQRLGVTTPSSDAQLGVLSLPKGKSKTDEFFGEQEVYYDELLASVAVSRAPGGELSLPLAVTFQGCAEAGLCYPPETKQLAVLLPAGSGSAAPPPPARPFVSEQDRLAVFVRDGQLFGVLATFFGLGLLLSLTPCVLPMVPILSGIIAGQGANVTTRRAFGLSLAYVLGMACTNTLAGIAAAAAGQQVQALFQQTWIIVLFAALFVAFALAMFGAFTIQMPAALQTRITDLSNRQRAGSYGGVAVMGALSALIVSACVAPPLFATLAVIGQTGEVFRGGSALFAMSLGMGAPLLAIGTSAGKLLPRAGAWMETVKRAFGALMLAVAAWMLARIVPAPWTLLLWAVPAAAAAWVLWNAAAPRATAGLWALRAAGASFAAYALVLCAGAALGGTNPLAPLPFLIAEKPALEFKRVKSVAELDLEVAAASAAGRPVMLDFYADWCVSCKEMEAYTFSDAEVQRGLANAVLLKADVTAHNADDQALLKRFGIFGPPTIAFYGPDGEERSEYRVVGYMKAEQFGPLSREAIAAR